MPPHGVYHFVVIRRLYVNNYRCLQNFDLPISGKSSALLIGKNGAGKTTVSFALEILQKIARGTNRVGELVKPKDFTRGFTDAPMRFEIEVEIDNKIYGYSIAFELPDGFKELRILDEKLEVDGKPVYVREIAQVKLAREGQENAASFRIDWHLVALPIIQEKSKNDPLFILKQWFAKMLILRPDPHTISGESTKESLRPSPEIADLGAWFTGLVTQDPPVYAKIDEYLKQAMPDLKGIQNPKVGTDSRNILVQFGNNQGNITLSFADLSDGEKVFFICALVLAASSIDGPLFCFWDEPDNFLSLEEVGHFIMTLRRAFQSGGQFIATSHNSEAIRSFSDENTLVLYRKSHLEPTIVRLLEELQIDGDLISTLIRGDLDL